MSSPKPINDLSWVKHSSELGLTHPASTVRSWTELLRYRRLQWAGHETEQNLISYRPEDVVIPPTVMKRRRVTTKSEWILLTKISDYSLQDFQWIDSIARGVVPDATLREAEIHSLRAWRQAHHSLILSLSKCDADLTELNPSSKLATSVLTDIKHAQNLMDKATKMWKRTQRIRRHNSPE